MGEQTHPGPSQARINPLLLSGSTKCSKLHAFYFCNQNFNMNHRSQSTIPIEDYFMGKLQKRSSVWWVCPHLCKESRESQYYVPASHMIVNPAKIKRRWHNLIWSLEAELPVNCLLEKEFHMLSPVGPRSLLMHGLLLCTVRIQSTIVSTYWHC